MSFCFIQPWWLNYGGILFCGHWPCCECGWSAMRTQQSWRSTHFSSSSQVFKVWKLHTSTYMQGFCIPICNKILWIGRYFGWYAENNTSDSGVTFFASEQKTTGDCGLWHSYYLIQLVIVFLVLKQLNFCITNSNAFTKQLRPHS